MNSRMRAQEVVAQERAGLADLSHGYPANHFAWRVVLDSAHQRGARNLVEVGVGHGNGIAHVIAAGLNFSGFDNDPSCVASAQGVAKDLGTASAVILGDIEKPETLAGLTTAGDFDSLMALGILPSVSDQAQTLRNMTQLLRPGGEMFVECRNSLFSLFTFNRFTRDFIVEDLLSEIPSDLRAEVDAFIEPRVDVERPPRPASGPVPAQHNPLAVSSLFASVGLIDISVHPFHFHAAMPALEAGNPSAFRTQSLALEDDASGWKGLFLCSAFLVRAVRPLSTMAA